MHVFSHNGDGQTMGCISPVLSFSVSTEERTLFCFSLNGASATKCALWRYFVAPFVNKTSYTEMLTAVFEFC